MVLLILVGLNINEYYGQNSICPLGLAEAEKGIEAVSQVRHYYCVNSEKRPPNSVLAYYSIFS